MDINDLESVCAVDICHNYSEAAESIASSPAVISKHIAKIEKELGLRIFERASKSRPVELTPAGKELITYFHSIVGLYKQMSTRASELRREGSGSLVVGYCPFIGNFHEAEMLTQFSLENPEISVRRRALNAPELVRALLAGTVNAIFLPIMYGPGVDYSKYGELPASDFIVEELFQLNTLTLGIPDGHPLAQCEHITRDMFPLLHDETFFFSCAQQNTPLSDRQRNQIYQLLGFKNDMKVRFVDFNEPTIALKLVESGAGLLPQACAVPRRIRTVNFVPVENDTIRTGLYYIQRRNISCPALRKLRKCVHEFVGKYS